MPFIMLTVLIDMVSIGLIIPVLPLLVGSFAASPADQTFWFGVTTFTFTDDVLTSVGYAEPAASALLGPVPPDEERRPEREPT